MRTCESVDELARELGVTRRCLYKWRTKLEAVEAGEKAARPSTYALAHRKEILQLKRLLAAKGMEVDFLKGALQTVEARRQKKGELARWHLRRNPGSDVIARQLKYRAYTCIGVSQPGAPQEFTEELRKKRIEVIEV